MAKTDKYRMLQIDHITAYKLYFVIEDYLHLTNKENGNVNTFLDVKNVKVTLLYPVLYPKSK